MDIHEGSNILDSNILACSRDHILNVFEMLKAQRDIQFTGGLESKRLEYWHLEYMRKLSISQMFFAYDTPDDLEPLVEAGRKLRLYNYTRRHCRCFVLIGHKKDTFELAQKRLMAAWDAGFMPMAMLWKDAIGSEDPAWRKFQRVWCRPALTKIRVFDLLRESTLQEFER